jgi:hypothetical protein
VALRAQCGHKIAANEATGTGNQDRLALVETHYSPFAIEVMRTGTMNSP